MKETDNNRNEDKIFFFGYKGSKKILQQFYKTLQKEIHLLESDEDIEPLVEMLCSSKPYTIKKKYNWDVQQIVCHIS
jgi:hypothetical protein